MATFGATGIFSLTDAASAAAAATAGGGAPQWDDGAVDDLVSTSTAEAVAATARKASAAAAAASGVAGTEGGEEEAAGGGLFAGLKRWKLGGAEGAADAEAARARWQDSFQRWRSDVEAAKEEENDNLGKGRRVRTAVQLLQMPAFAATEAAAAAAASDDYESADAQSDDNADEAAGPRPPVPRASTTPHANLTVVVRPRPPAVVTLRGSLQQWVTNPHMARSARIKQLLGRLQAAQVRGRVRYARVLPCHHRPPRAAHVPSGERSATGSRICSVCRGEGWPRSPSSRRAAAPDHNGAAHAACEERGAEPRCTGGRDPCWARRARAARPAR